MGASADKSTKETTSEDLLTQLNLHHQHPTKKCMICGFPTKNGSPCKIEVVNHEGVRNSVRELYSNKYAGMELQNKLKTLLEQVNCGCHSQGHFQEQRIREWTEIFQPLTVSEEIEKLFYPVFNTCYGSTADGANRKNRLRGQITAYGAKCKNRLRGQNVQHIHKTVEAIKSSEVFLDADNLEYALKVWGSKALCSHHQHQAETILLKFDAKIIDIYRRTQFSSSPQINDINSPAGELIKARRAKKPPSECWPDAFDTSRLATRIDKDRPKTEDNVFKMIEKTLREELRKEEAPSLGYVYIYQVESNSDHVKIGFTTKEVETRLAKWTSDCNRKCTQVYPALHSDSIPVPTPGKVEHPLRIEALCHAELAATKELVDCTACIVTHNEWFRERRNRAIAVMQKWSEWMTREKPYEEHYGTVIRNNKTETSKVWRLTERVEQQLNQGIEAFMRNVSGNPALPRETVKTESESVPVDVSLEAEQHVPTEMPPKIKQEQNFVIRTKKSGRKGSKSDIPLVTSVKTEGEVSSETPLNTERKAAAETSNSKPRRSARRVIIKDGQKSKEVSVQGTETNSMANKEIDEKPIKKSLNGKQDRNANKPKARRDSFIESE